MGLKKGERPHRGWSMRARNEGGKAGRLAGTTPVYARTLTPA